jgi:antitoxin component of MazEF toxin-antitoxin module
LSQKYEIRRPHFEGKKEASCRVILPAKFVEHIGIMKGDYVRIYEEQNRILVERLTREPQEKIMACRVNYSGELVDK